MTQKLKFLLIENKKSGWGSGGCDLKIKVIVKLKKSVGGGGSGGCDPRIERKKKLLIIIYQLKSF